ncbi:substrate-binding periplasmic protein [Bdellovibrio bacteriovorus]|uniref:substrate-binding periplasmic protein n=1 Tax=Bdellovibrio bacteriovorus TaxID=959 RepID=UPI0035A585C3
MPFLLLVLFLFSPWAEAKKIIFASDPYPPFIYEQNGEAKGTAVDALEKILEIPRKDLEIRIIPWKRALKAAEQGSVDIIGPMQIDPKKDYLLFTKKVFPSEEAVWTLASSQYLSQLNWKTTEELRNHNLGYVLGYEYAEPFGSYLKSPLAKKVEVQDVIQGMRKLLSGDISLFICNTQVLEFYAKSEGIPLKTFKRIGPPIVEEFGVFGISHKSKLARDLDKINARISKLPPAKSALN